MQTKTSFRFIILVDARSIESVAVTTLGQGLCLAVDVFQLKYDDDDNISVNFSKTKLVLTYGHQETVHLQRVERREQQREASLEHFQTRQHRLVVELAHVLEPIHVGLQFNLQYTNS